MPNQPAANQDFPDDGLYCAFVDPPNSLIGAKDMLENSRPQSNTTDHQRSNPNRHIQPSVGPWMSGDSSKGTDHNHRNFTQGQYSTQSVSTSISQDLAIPPLQNDPYSTATNILPSISRFGSWNDTPTLRSTQYHDPASGSARVGYSSSPAMGSGYSFPSTTQKVYPNDRSVQSGISSQHTVANHTPFVFDPTMPASDFSPYNILPHQWQTRTVPQPGPLSLPVTPMIPPQLAEESSRFIFVMQPHASHGEQISHPSSSNQPPVHQPYLFPPHSHPSPSIWSCLWLDDGAVTPCGFAGTLKALKSHCKNIHFTGPKIAQIKCHWEGCDYCKRGDPAVHVMRRDCMWRHTREVHLRLKRGSI
ncbi:hypothetical protein EDD22DRAFT_579603 [Suillus occidentalis]|nr:hypothetical protein EDD22DRAFT_579603 [Suillus occidentalis]